MQRQYAALQQQMRVFFEHAPLPVLRLDRSGLVESLNERAARLLGPPRPDGRGDNRFSERLGREHRLRLHQALRHFLSSKPLLLDRLELTDAPDRPVTVDAHLTCLQGEEEQPPGALVFLVEKTAEVELDRERSFFAAMLDSSESFIYAVDRMGKLLLANKAVLDFYGLRPEEVIGRRREDLLSLRDAARHDAIDRIVRDSGEPRTLEESVRIGLTGGEVELVTRKFPLRDPENRIYGVGAIATDVTAFKRVQYQARLSESVFLMASEAIIVADAQMRIVRVNPAFTVQSGFSLPAVAGKPISILRAVGEELAEYESMWTVARRDGRWAGELRNRAADGRDYTVWCSVSAISDDHGKAGQFVVIQTDTSALQAAQAEVRRLALFDKLTGLPNRALFDDRLRGLIEQAHRRKHSFGVVFIDLDHFKEVNDTLGHDVGDELLRQTARRLKDALRSEDTVGRLGGDEFVVLLCDADRQSAHLVAEKLLLAVRQPVTLGSIRDYRPKGSAGVAIYPADGDSADVLLRNADIAMYRAKQTGRDQVRQFDLEMAAESARLFTIQSALAQAVARDELAVHYQPKFDLGSGALVGAEALVRWQRPGEELLSPGEFIPIAEKSGLVVEIDQWVLGQVMKDLRGWKQAGLWKPGWRVAVNLSAKDLQRPGLPSELMGLLGSHDVPGDCIEIEITEGAMLEHTTENIERLSAIRQLDVTLALDDFGTNYSSLSYLRRLPVQVIKIDRSFVGGMLTSESDLVLVATIISMAHSLGRTVVAEGIELEGQWDRLRNLGCEMGQGYLMGRPMTGLQFAQDCLMS